jgi:hypothetical protein
VSYVILYDIDPDNAHLIPEMRPRHLDYVKNAATKINLAGITTSADGARMERSVFILNVPTLAQAQEFSAGDPYVQAGIFRAPYIASFDKRIAWTA